MIHVRPFDGRRNFKRHLSKLADCHFRRFPPIIFPMADHFAPHRAAIDPVRFFSIAGVAMNVRDFTEMFCDEPDWFSVVIQFSSSSALNLPDANSARRYVRHAG